MALSQETKIPRGKERGATEDTLRRLAFDTAEMAVALADINIAVATISVSVSGAEAGTTEAWFGAAVPVGVETTVFTKVIPLTGDFFVHRVNYSGRGPALFRLKVGGVTIDYGQIVWTKRADDHNFTPGHKVLAGSTITLTVFSYDSVATDFFGSFSGRQA